MAWLPFKSRERLLAENAALRQRVSVLRRRSPRRPKLRPWDRLVFTWLYRLWPDVLDAIVVVRPETVLRWHRLSFKAFWRWKCRRPPGRPRIPNEFRDLFRQISLANPLLGAPRIHGDLLKIGIEVAQSTVAKYIVKGRRSPTQSWKTSLANEATGVDFLDLFVVPSASFKLPFALVILRHGRRRLVHVSATSNPTADWHAGQLLEAFTWETTPEYLLRDRDRVFGTAYRRRVRRMGIRDRPVAPRSSWQNGYAERLIGSVRRECVDHLIVFNAAHLRRVLSAYTNYCNRAGTRQSLHKDSPVSRPIQPRARITSVPHLGGLHRSFVII